MHFLMEEHEPVLPPPKTQRSPDERNRQPGGSLREAKCARETAVWSDRPSAVAAASHLEASVIIPEPQLLVVTKYIPAT